MKLHAPNVAVFVDYDNVVIDARSASFSVSFVRLKEALREFGNILFSYAFVSPSSSRRENVAKLTKAGFVVVACPMATKDRDSVDTKISWLARAHLEHSEAQVAVIVSRDSDFRDLVDFARDRGKVAVFFNVLQEQVLVEGNDDLPQLVDSRQLLQFRAAFDHLQNGHFDASCRDCEDVDNEMRANFIRDVICHMKSIPENMRYSFSQMREYLWHYLRERWIRTFQPAAVRFALMALRDAEVVSRNFSDSGIAYYVLNRQHPLLQSFISEPTETAAPQTASQPAS